MDFKALLALMVEKKASDLFITAGRPPCLKVNGKIAEVSKTQLTGEQTLMLVLSIMSQRQRDEFENTKECQFALSVQGLGRFRVSAFTQRDSAGMVLRRIESKIPTVEELMLPPIINELAMTKRGLIVFVGATGTHQTNCRISRSAFSSSGERRARHSSAATSPAVRNRLCIADQRKPRVSVRGTLPSITPSGVIV